MINWAARRSKSPPRLNVTIGAWSGLPVRMANRSAALARDQAESQRSVRCCFRMAGLDDDLIDRSCSSKVSRAGAACAQFDRDYRALPRAACETHQPSPFSSTRTGLEPSADATHWTGTKPHLRPVPIAHGQASVTFS